MNKSPAYQHYPDKATAGTQHLSPEAFKAYWLMLWWMWLHSDDHCSIADDPGAWAIAMQTTKEKAQQVMAEVMQEYMPMLKRSHGKLVSGGLQKEAKKQAEKRKQAQTAAKSRWPNKKRAKRTHSERIDSASFPQSSPTPSPIPSPATHKNKPIPDIPEWLKETWADFLSHRKQMRKPMTHEAQRRMVKRVLDKGESIGKAGLEMAMERGWLAPVWDHKDLIAENKPNEPIRQSVKVKVW